MYQDPNSEHWRSSVGNILTGPRRDDLTNASDETLSEENNIKPEFIPALREGVFTKPTFPPDFNILTLSGLVDYYKRCVYHNLYHAEEKFRFAEARVQSNKVATCIDALLSDIQYFREESRKTVYLAAAVTLLLYRVPRKERERDTVNIETLTDILAEATMFGVEGKTAIFSEHVPLHFAKYVRSIYDKYIQKLQTMVDECYETVGDELMLSFRPDPIDGRQ